MVALARQQGRDLPAQPLHVRVHAAHVVADRDQSAFQEVRHRRGLERAVVELQHLRQREEAEALRVVLLERVRHRELEAAVGIAAEHVADVAPEAVCPDLRDLDVLAGDQDVAARLCLLGAPDLAQHPAAQRVVHQPVHVALHGDSRPVAEGERGRQAAQAALAHVGQDAAVGQQEAQLVRLAVEAVLGQVELEAHLGAGEPERAAHVLAHAVTGYGADLAPVHHRLQLHHLVRRRQVRHPAGRAAPLVAVEITVVAGPGVNRHGLVEVGHRSSCLGCMIASTGSCANATGSG